MLPVTNVTVTNENPNSVGENVIY